jgi:hypothetical protein
MDELDRFLEELDRDYERWRIKQQLKFIEDIELPVKMFCVCMVVVVALEACLSGIALLEMWRTP